MISGSRHKINKINPPISFDGRLIPPEIVVLSTGLHSFIVELRRLDNILYQFDEVAERAITI